MQKDQT